VVFVSVEALRRRVQRGLFGDDIEEMFQRLMSKMDEVVGELRKTNEKLDAITKLLEGRK
jgi:predicted RNase H-like HicB family nuclease